MAVRPPLVGPDPGRCGAVAALGPGAVEVGPPVHAHVAVGATAVATGAPQHERPVRHGQVMVMAFGPPLEVKAQADLPTAASARPLLVLVPAARAVPVRPARLVLLDRHAAVARLVGRAPVIGVPPRGRPATVPPRVAAQPIGLLPQPRHAPNARRPNEVEPRPPALGPPQQPVVPNKVGAERPLVRRHAHGGLDATLQPRPPG